MGKLPIRTKSNFLASMQRLITNSRGVIGLFTKAPSTITLIFFVIPFKPDDLRIALKSKNMSSHTIQKPAVVTNDHGTASKAFQGLFQYPQGLHIKVIGWLIQ